MPTYKPYTDVSDLPANSGGERTILEAHLDAAHGTITDVLERLTQTLFTSGGVVVPGAVTNPEGALVRVVGRLGVSSDCKTLLAVGDAAVDLASVATGTRCLVVIRALAGASTDHTFTDPTTGEVIVHSLLSQWGRLAVLEGDASAYPPLPADCVPVAQVTKTGASSLTLDSVITTAPTPRYAGGGGGGGAAWGGIAGDLEDQADLAAELGARPTSSSVTVIEAMTQAAYDALPSKDPATLYVITDA